MATDKKISELGLASAFTGVEKFELVQGGLNVAGTPEQMKTYIGGSTREFGRTWAQEILFDKNEIDYDLKVMDANITFSPAGSGNLADAFCVAIQQIQCNGVNSINFSGIDYIYGIETGDIPDQGTYQIMFMYRNGITTANWLVPSTEEANLVPLAAPANFAAAPDSVNSETEIDLTWTDVTGEISYLIEFSLTGTGGWSTLSEPAAGSTAATQTGLSAGVTRYYRIKAIGDGVTNTDSQYSLANATTESSGDVTAPTFTFLPANAATDWPVNKPITITANEACQNTDGSEITNANAATRITLKLTNAAGADIAKTVTIDATKKIFTIFPTDAIAQNQAVYVAINNVEDVNGNEVTVAVSATFTTGEYTFFNGTTNKFLLGDILDSLFASSSTNFQLECTIRNYVLSGTRRLITKQGVVGDGTDRTFSFHYGGDDVVFSYYMGNTQVRTIRWTDALADGAEHKLMLDYQGTINTNDGLDRVTLEVDDVEFTTKVLSITSGTLTNTLLNATAQLAAGTMVNSAGNPPDSSWFSGEMKNIIIRSANGAVTELNIANIKLGTDSSGNSRDGTFF